MEGSVTNRLTRDSSPNAIEEDLAALWADAARDAPIARALMANLVVFRDCPAAHVVNLSAPIEGLPIDDVAERHPSRLILLHHGGRPDPGAPVGATISILLFGTAGARFGVEEIAVRSTCAEASLPSIVRRLVARRRADVGLVDGRSVGLGSARSARDDGTPARCADSRHWSRS